MRELPKKYENIRAYVYPQYSAMKAIVPTRSERALMLIIDGLEEYQETYFRANNRKIQDDGFAHEYFADMVRGARAMLNMETGRLDCAVLDRILVGMLPTEEQ